MNYLKNLFLTNLVEVDIINYKIIIIFVNKH